MPDEAPVTTDATLTTPAVPAAPAPTSWTPDGPLDPDRITSLVNGLQGDKAKLKAERDAQLAELEAANAKIAQYEAAQLSEAERKDKELADARAEVANARRDAALLKFGLDDSARVFLTGTTSADIEAQATALAALKGTPAPTPPSSSVTPALAPVTAPGTPTPGTEHFDAKALALEARQRRY